MPYKKFIIKGYKGITKNLIIDVEKNSLIPIIGINESGKTTILQSILSFDRFNDEENNGIHLLNLENMYSTEESDLKIEAELEVDYYEIKEILDEIKVKYSGELEGNIANDKKNKILKALKDIEEYVLRLNKINNNGTINLVVGRSLKTLKYYFDEDSEFNNKDLNEDILHEVMRILPYTLYFDDFKDRLDEKIHINTKSTIERSKWVEIIDRLFQLTNPSYSVYDLPNKNQNIRWSILAEVEEKLNEELLKEWPNFSIQLKEPLKIKINYLVHGENHFLEFLVIEKIVLQEKEKERYFKLEDRSKGFYWYFNFTMKLIFNTKNRGFKDSTIYLLDEPGSYLHSTAQFKLTRRLRDISKKNTIIYCTHSPYLLDPQIIPINSIKIAEKNNEGSIELKSAFETKNKLNKKNSALQPIYDALDVRPLLLDYDIDNVVLVEGMYDYLSFEMFKSQSKLNFFPCVNADSILNNISYMIFLKKKYLALWDNDEEGNNQYKKAKLYFGDREAQRFHILPKALNRKRSRLEDIYDLSELSDYKLSISMPKNQSFEKVILHLFYSKDRAKEIKRYFSASLRNFEKVISLLESTI